MKELTNARVLAVLASLGAMGCNKSSERPQPEPVPSAVKSDATPAGTAAVDTKAPNAVGAKEVPKAAGDGGSKEKEKGCAPGGCAPGQCGAGK
jgi:hypothetical protein